MPDVILVVDDEPFVLKVVSEILANKGFYVLRAPSPEAALQLARRYTGPIRLMLSDVVMPGLHGPDLAEAVAVLHPETQSLFTAGMPDTAEVYDRILSPGRAFLPKPFAARTLLAKIEEVLGGQSVAAG